MPVWSIDVYLQNFQLYFLIVLETLTYYWKNRETTIDLIFRSDKVIARIISCCINTYQDCNLDHLPISTAFIQELQLAALVRKQVWGRINVAQLQQTVKEQLLLILASTNLKSKQQIDKYIDSIVNALYIGINTSTPQSNLLLYSIPRFGPECKEICHEV